MIAALMQKSMVAESSCLFILKGTPMKRLLFVALTLSFSMASAVTETSTGSFSGFEQTAVTASSRSEALITESQYYSLPHKDMTYFDLGTYNQRQKYDSDISKNNRLSNQVFYFNHARGLSQNVALDFNLDYSVRDENSVQGSTGVNSMILGLRSHFNAMGMQWIYGANMGYLPQGELRASDSKAVVTARIGFEETVDIARWGAELVGSSQNTAFFDDQLNLQAFFEMPFVRRFDVGVSAGADINHLSSSAYNNFARVYGDASLDSVSSARLSLRQNNQMKESASLSEAEVGLALTRVF